MSLITQHPSLFGAWVIWCLGHSLPATKAIKEGLSKLHNLTPQRYRQGYVLFSLLTLTPLLFWQWQVSAISAPASWPWQITRICLFSYSVWMLYAGGQSYNLKEFLGITVAVVTNETGQTPLHRNGILSRVRHPMYSGGIALLIALGTTPGDRWDLRLLLAAYLIFGCLIEERRLITEYGELYREYMRDVPMLLPRPGKTWS